MQYPKKSKQVALAGALVGVAAASVKTRQHIEATHAAHASPFKLSLRDWKNVAIGTKDALGSKNLPTLAAGVAYYATLALFPFLAAAVAIAALLISAEQIDALVSVAETYLPADIARVIASQLHGLVARRADNLLAAGIAIAIALFGASGASKSLVTASNAVYGTKESRGWLAQQVWGVIWTIVGIVFGAVIVTLLAVNQTVLGHIGMPQWVSTVLVSSRWLLLVLCSVSGLAFFYRHGPNRARVRWHWVGVGASLATVVWLGATSLFFAYVQNFANYTQSYSLFAGIIALMIWMNLSAFIVLIGAEINHQLETASHKKWGSFSPEHD